MLLPDTISVPVPSYIKSVPEPCRTLVIEAEIMGDAPHGYACAGDLAARFSLTVFEPGVGTTSGSGASGD